MMVDLREPVSALSHGLGMVLALPVTFWLLKSCSGAGGGAGSRSGSARPVSFEKGKRLSLLIFGLSVLACYGGSAIYHGATVSGESLVRLRQLDHIGIYLLIAGTYTPGAWALMNGGMRRGTLVAVWTVALLCSARVWLAGALPIWISTLTYMAMGWGVLVCYRELVRIHGHRKLLPLPLGGAFYSVGAIINLLGHPVFLPGVFGSHELFHCLVLAGTACHVGFMFHAVIPAAPPAGWDTSWPEVDVTTLSPSLDLASEANGIAA